MKILRLELRAFGPFTDVVLDLSAGREGLHLVYGPNEAGKSSSLRALGQLLYGIPGNSTDNFRHPYPKLRIGAALARRDGTRLEVLRRKGLKNTLLGPDDKTLVDDAELRTFLGGCDQAQFDSMFGINHRALVAGGQEIVRGQGEVGHVLFAAGSGIADLRAVRAALENEADTLFASRASKPAINQALAALKDARRRMREAQLPSSDWTQRDTALREASGQLAATESDLQKAMREDNRFARLSSALPVIGKRKQFQHALEALGDVPRLAADFAEQRRDAETQLLGAERAEQAAREALEQIERQMAGLQVSEELLAHAEEIEEVYRALSVYRKAQADLPGLQAKKEQLERDALALLADLRPDLPLEAAPQLQLAKRQQVEIQNLGNRQEALQKQLEQATAQIEESQRRQEEIQSQLDAQASPRDAGPLKEAVRQAQAEGNLSQQWSAAVAETRQLRQQAEVQLKRLGLWQGPLEAVESLPLPALETIDRFEREWTEAHNAVARCQEGVDKTQAAVAELERRLEELRLEGDVPSEDDLAAARRRRQAGWDLVLQTWRQDQADAAALAEFLAYGEAKTDLASAYEQAVRVSDDVADRLRREANRVATRATLQANRALQQQQLATMAEQLRGAREAHEASRQAWAECWRPANIDPLPPREMRAWLQRQQAVVAQVQAARAREAATARLAECIAEHRGRVERRLAELGQAEAGASEELPAVLARAAAVAAEIDRAVETRRHLERDLAQSAQALGAARAKAKKAEAELAQWHGQWAAAIERLGLVGDAAPAVVNEVVAQTNDLFARLKEAQSFVERITAIRQDGRRFQEDLERLARQVAPDLAAAGHEAAAAELFARLRKAVADRQKLALLTEQGKQQEEKRGKARAVLDAMHGRLRTLCREAGCEVSEELLQVEGKAVQAAAFRQQLADCEEELLRLGAGATIESLLAEAEAVHADELPVQLRQVREHIAALQAQRDGLRDTIASEKTELARMDPSAAAAEAAVEVQSLLAEIQPNVEQYARLRLASAVLREGIDRYRKKNEGPVLARAGELFRRLTLGSYEGLKTDFDDRGEQVLLGVRPGGEGVSPIAMSEGACDQLYLALRLASLETWLERNEPLPFIVDDILISFDNDRSTATLEVLAELSRRTQVIFFTHHAHLVEIAEGRVPEGALFVHRL